MHDLLEHPYAGAFKQVCVMQVGDGAAEEDLSDLGPSLVDKSNALSRISEQYTSKAPKHSVYQRSSLPQGSRTSHVLETMKQNTWFDKAHCHEDSKACERRFASQ